MNKRSIRHNATTAALLAISLQLGGGTIAYGETLLNGTLPLPDGGMQAARTKVVKTTAAPVPVVTPNVVAQPVATSAPVTTSAADAPTLRGLDGAAPATAAAEMPAAPVDANAPTLRGLDSNTAAAAAAAAANAEVTDADAVAATSSTTDDSDAKTAAPAAHSRMARFFHRGGTPNTTPAAQPPQAAEQPAAPTPAARMRALFHRKAAEPTTTAPKTSAAPASNPVTTAAAVPTTTVTPTEPAAASDATDLSDADKLIPAPGETTAVAPSTVAPTGDASDLHDDEKSFDLHAEQFHLTTPIKQNPQMALLPSTAGAAGKRASIYIDNDEEVEQVQTVKYEELQLDETKTKVKAGCKFPIVITSEITSRTAKVGDPVQGRLKYDLKIADRVVASKGSNVRGHLNYALPARTPMRSMLSLNRWYKNSGCLGIAFDEIINERGEHIPLVAEPARSNLYVKNKAEGRVLGINEKGQIAGPWSQQLRYKAIRVGLNAAMSPLGPMTFGAMPIALGVMGAVNPSFAFMKPVGENVRHRRIKGFFWGALSGVPGSWLIEDTTVKGQEAVVKPGDEFLAEFRQEFTGEPATDAEMLGGDNGKVHGEVVGADKNNKLKKLGRKKQSASRPQHTI